MSAARGEGGAVIRLAAMLAGAAHTFAWRTRLGALAGALVAVAIGLSACGSSGSDDVTIPKANSDQLLSALDQVQKDCASQLRAEAVTAAQTFIDAVNALPKEVGIETKDALRNAGENLRTQASKCEAPSGTSDVSTTSATTVPPVTPSTSTSTSTTTSTESQPPPQNPGEGNGQPGGGNSGGNGGGNGGSGGIGGGKSR